MSEQTETSELGAPEDIMTIHDTYTEQPSQHVGERLDVAAESAAEEEIGTRHTRRFFVNIQDKQGYERRVTGLPVNSNSQVFVTICELGFFGGALKPFMGAASMEVHNVVPHDDGSLIVRGFIGWDQELLARLNIGVA
ncbi:hypothetical protein ACOQFL_10075 [Actinopolyspora sp. H202]|uniref:hypothetical protein n=1 Tax=Actinopolyspora sp. H202 TaxID=1500456 RepID=UPI003EE7BE55